MAESQTPPPVENPDTSRVEGAGHDVPDDEGPLRGGQMLAEEGTKPPTSAEPPPPPPPKQR